jgi:hypothetical protein
MPGMIPWETKLVNTPAGSSLFAKVLNEAKVLSIKSIGTLDHSENRLKYYKMTKKITYPHSLWVKHDQAYYENLLQ